MTSHTTTITSHEYKIHRITKNHPQLLVRAIRNENKAPEELKHTDKKFIGFHHELANWVPKHIIRHETPTSTSTSERGKPETETSACSSSQPMHTKTLGRPPVHPCEQKLHPILLTERPTCQKFEQIFHQVSQVNLFFEYSLTSTHNISAFTAFCILKLTSKKTIKIIFHLKNYLPPILMCNMQPLGSLTL